MRRLILFLIGGTVIFHIIYANFQINVQRQEIQSLKTAIINIEQRVRRSSADPAIKRDFGVTVDSMNRTHPDAMTVPQWPAGK